MSLVEVWVISRIGLVSTPGGDAFKKEWIELARLNKGEVARRVRIKEPNGAGSCCLGR